MPDTVRAHVSFPKRVLEELDERAGSRGRSEVIVELVEEYLRRQHTMDVWRRFQGSMNPEDHPEWANQEDIDRWVHEHRRDGDRSFGWRDDGTSDS
jgi:hypothetical protein